LGASKSEKIRQCVQEIFQILKKNYNYTPTDFTIKDAMEFATAFYEERGIKGRRLESLVAASIYLACESCACPIPLKMARVVTDWDKSLIYFLRELRDKLKQRYPLKPSHWKKGIFRRLKHLSEIDEEQILYINKNFDSLCSVFEQNKKLQLHFASKASRFLALTFLYLASLGMPNPRHLTFGYRLTQKKISQLFFIEAVTIRNTSHKFLKILGTLNLVQSLPTNLLIIFKEFHEVL